VAESYITANGGIGIEGNPVDSKDLSLDSLLDWAKKAGTETDNSIKSAILNDAPSKLQAFTVIAAQTNMSRIQKLAHALNTVQDKILERIDELTTSQLIQLRGYLERDMSASVDKMLPRANDGTVNPIQILNFISALPPASKVEATSNGLDASSREKVRSFVMAAMRSGQVPNASPDLRVINGSGSEIK